MCVNNILKRIKGKKCEIILLTAWDCQTVILHRSLGCTFLMQEIKHSFLISINSIFTLNSSCCELEI